MRDRASGFCVYNDVAVAAAWLSGRANRVAVVDVDVHHGDGTQGAVLRRSRGADDQPATRAAGIPLSPARVVPDETG